jgi:putative ABC transport system permease protein
MNEWIDVVRVRLTEVGGSPPDPDVIEEFAAHLAQVYESARGRGGTHEEALHAALRLLEGSNPILQALRAHQPPIGRQVSDWARQEPAAYNPSPGKGAWMSRLDLVRDARYALRMLVRTPAFSLIAILTFAVGIGVNTAVFSVVNGVLLRSLPYPDADRITLVWLDNRRMGIKEDITSYPNYLDWRNQNSVYAHLAAFDTLSFSLTGAGEPERLRGAEVTANFFDVMGVRPSMGRVFAVENEVEGQDAVVLLSHGLWQRRFAGAADVIGRTIALSGRQYEIIGVMPPELRWPEKAELWAPLSPDPNTRDARLAFWLPVMGRLKPGISVEQAQTEMSGISTRLEQTIPQMKGYGANVVPLHQQLVGNIEKPLLVLMSAVGFVLLIACANLANLMLGRTAARRKELAIRTALGAGRGRIIRQIVTEALVLALLGGTMGILLSYWATSFFVALGGPSIPRPEAIVLDARVMLFALGLATASAVLSGLIPAIHASLAAVTDRLREGGRQSGGSASRSTRNALVAAEVALALVLLTGAGLLMRTLWSMQSVDRGFSAERIVVATVSPPAASYPNALAVRGFYQRLLERVRAMPGVESAALASGVLQPLVTNSGLFTIEGQPLPPPEERVEYPFESVSPGFFETLRFQLALGRTFTDQDHADAPRVIVVNEALARMAWPNQDPLGRRLRAGGPQSQAPWMTVIGVIKDARRANVTRAIRPELYFSSLQSTTRTQTIVLRSAGDPAAQLSALRREVQALDPQLPLFEAGTLADEISTTLTQPRFQATLLAWFAGIALLLATVGIYGVTSHAVNQRTQEVGIRMALGASAADVLALMLVQHLRPAFVGIAVGIGTALILSRSLRSLLYGVSAADPLTFVLVAAALVGVAVVACLIPSRRAMRVDPLEALRAE